MKKPLIIGVMGGGTASPEDTDAAYRLGALIAQQGWILLNGGRNAGIMEASAKGASEHDGLTVGILPDDNDNSVSAYIQIPVLTGMGSARNAVNVLSSHVVVACPGGAGTISEIALALKHRRRVILLNFDVREMFDSYVKQGLLHYAETPDDVIEQIRKVLRVKG